VNNRQRERLAQASRRQMTRLRGEPEPTDSLVHHRVTLRQRSRSREQHEETQRLVRGDPGREGFFVRLSYGQVVETGVVRDAWRRKP